MAVCLYNLVEKLPVTFSAELAFYVCKHVWGGGGRNLLLFHALPFQNVCVMRTIKHSEELHFCSWGGGHMLEHSEELGFFCSCLASMFHTGGVHPPPIPSPLQWQWPYGL